MSRRPWALAGWALAAIAVAAWLTLVEILWLPLRIGPVLVPISVLAAVAGNLMLVWAFARWSRSRVVGVLPAAVWLAMVLAASRRTAEGDLLITGGGASGYVNLAFLLLGVVAAAFAVGRVLSAARRPAREDQTPASR